MPVVVRSARAHRVLVRPEIFPGRPEILSWAEHSRNSLLPGRSVSYRYCRHCTLPDGRMMRVERQLLASGSDDANDSPLMYRMTAYVEYGYNYASPLGHGRGRVEPKICLLDRSGESVNHPKVRASSVRASAILSAPRQLDRTRRASCTGVGDAGAERERLLSQRHPPPTAPGP